MLPDAKYYAKKRYEEMKKREKDAEFRQSLVQRNSNQTYEDNPAYNPSVYRDMSQILKDMREKD